MKFNSGKPKLKGGFQMDKSITITIIIVAAFLILGLVGIATFDNLANPMQEKISVSGQSSIKAMPDIVAIYFTVKSTADTSSEATTENAKIVDSLRTALIKQGFENKDIQTLNFNVYEDYSWENRAQKFNGYVATQTIRVEMSTDDTGKIGEVVDAGIEAGVQISYINFEISQELQNQYKAEAISLAAQDAKIKAESVAKGLDQRLEKLVSVSVNDWNYYPWRMYDYTEGTSASQVKAEGGTNIQPAEQDITATVQAVFRIR